MKNGIHIILLIILLKTSLVNTINVESPYGIEELYVPEGMQTGFVKAIKGKGVPNVRTKQKGDLYVTLNIETPKNLTNEQKELFKKIYSLDSNKKDKKRK